MTPFIHSTHSLSHSLILNRSHRDSIRSCHTRESIRLCTTGQGAATWNCKTCGMNNDAEETHYQIMVDDGKGGK
jgi:hypothetical protein